VPEIREANVAGDLAAREQFKEGTSNVIEVS
jgi:hypothetical protein